MKLLIAGGGTGGHVFPAIAIAKEWLSRGADRDVVLVGTQRGLEMKLVPAAGLPLETLRAAGLKGKGGATLAKNLAILGPGLMDAIRLLRKHRPVAAFGIGGYAAGPMLLATWMTGVPNMIFEPNAEPGFTNRVLARLSSRIAAGYARSARALGPKTIVTGCPVRAICSARVRQRRSRTVSDEHGGAFRLGRRDRLPRRRDYGQRTRRGGAPRDFHPVRRCYRQPPATQR